MFGRIALVTVVAVVGINVALVTVAQEEPVEGPRRPTLGERLQRFKQELIGEEMPKRRQPAPAPAAVPGASRKILGGQRRSASMPMQSAPMQTAPGVEMENAYQPTPAAGMPSASAGYPGPQYQGVPQQNSTIVVPPRMQTQGARPARPGATMSLAPPPPASGPEMELADEPGELAPAEGDQEPTLADPPAESASDESLPDATAEPSPEYASEEMTAESTPAEESAEAAGPAGADLPAAEPTPATPDESAVEEVQPAEQEMTDDAGQTSPAGLGPRPTTIEPAPSGFADEAPLDAPPTDEAPADEAPSDEAPVDGTPADAMPAPSADFSSAAAPDAPADAGDDSVLFSTASPVISVEAKGPKTMMIGKPAEFVVRMHNSGATANNVVVTVDIPNDAEVAAANPTLGTTRPAASRDRRNSLEWAIERLAANSAETLTLKLVPRASSPLELAVNWTFAPETSQTMVEVREPKLEMHLTGPTDVLFGETKIYKLTISNPGNGDTENVSVGLLPIGRSGEATGNHALGTLKAGESKTVDIELTARQAGAITIKAQAFADGGLRAEAAEQVLVRRASLQVEVEAPRVKYAGTAGTYRVKVQNAGNASAKNVRVVAMLPPDAKCTSASGGGRTDAQQGRVEWSIGSLEAGGQSVFELQCALHAAGDNRLQFTAAADGDVSAAATSTTRVEAIADLRLEVRDPRGPIAVGEEAVYEVRIENRGTKAAEGIDLACFFSEGLEPISADGGAHEIGVGQVVFDPIASLGPQETAVLHIKARAESAGNHVIRAELTCTALDTKLATEEATHFYGDRRPRAASTGEPTPAPTPAVAAGDSDPAPATPQP